MSDTTLTRPRPETLPWLMVAPAVILMAVFYIYPLLQVLSTSVTEPTPGLANYATLITSASIHHILITTARICVLTTFFALLLGYVVAYAITTGSERVRRYTLILVILPMWVSALVRAFAWVALLRREGIVNSLLETTGLITAPLPLVWNEFGVLVGMVHYMLPYAVLPLYANMRDIDQRCLQASRGLGASRLQTFVHVFLPLSVPGLAAAGALVFVYSLGFFVVPAILGGGKTLMIAEYIRLQIVELLDWGTGTMLACVLVVAVTAVLGMVISLIGTRRLFGAGQHE